MPETPKDTPQNTLFYGDNLAVMRDNIAAASVDLCYADPPFNSKRDYNLLFRESSGTAPASQIKAFGDSWTYGEETERARDEINEFAPRYGVEKLPQMLDGFLDVLGKNDVTAYLIMMAARLLEVHRVLKPTGSFYLHCDQTASHYLKIVLDVIFGKQNFRNEIIWKRRVGSSSAVHGSNRFGISTDTILFYAKSFETPFNPQYNRDSPEYQEYIRDRFTLVDESGRRFQATSLVNPAYRPNLIYEYKGFKPPENGWMISKEKMEAWDAEGRIYFPSEPNGRLRRKSYVDELRGMPIQNIWSDIQEINSQAQERLGYPTQKPVALLERILLASSDEGDVVLDPFCGCGTTIAAAQKLKRRWLGIDVTHLAVTLIEKRLRDAYDLKAKVDYRVVGTPSDESGALDLFGRDPYQFQFWALSLIPAYPKGGDGKVGKKGADAGIDGYIPFVDGTSRKTQQILVQVKGGKVGVSQIRDLRGVIERDKAAMGFFICLETPTAPMLTEAAGAGLYTSEIWKGKFARLQIRTVAQLLRGENFDYPKHSASVWKSAAKESGASDELKLEFES